MLLFRRSWIIAPFFYLAYNSHKLIVYNMNKIQLPACLQQPADLNTLPVYLEAYRDCLGPPVLTLRYLYLSELLRPYILNRNLRSSNNNS